MLPGRRDDEAALREARKSYMVHDSDHASLAQVCPAATGRVVVDG